MANNDDDLVGFKDFLEEERKKGDSKSTQRARNDGFELLTFLEQDSARIEKLIQLFEEKSYILKNFPQSAEILAQISTHRDLLKKQLVDMLGLSSADFLNNLSDIFEEHFKDNS